MGPVMGIDWIRTPPSPNRFIRLTLLLLIASPLRHTYVTATNSTSSSSNNSSNYHSDATRLLRDVIDAYDSRLRPVRNGSQPIKIFTTYSLVNLQEIDELNQRMAVNIWVNFSWWDEMRTWNLNDYGGNDIIHPRQKDIWLPNTVLINSIDERDVFGDENAPLSIYSNGATRWYTGGLYYFSCTMDLTYFPFDEQTCTAKIMSTNLGEEIEFIPVSTSVQIRDYSGHGEWIFKASKFQSFPFQERSNELLVFLTIELTFKRRAKFYILNIVVPIMCLSVLSIFSFVVPKESGERTSFSITVLLSLSFFLVTISDALPANSETYPIVGMYLSSLLSLSMLSVVIIVCQQRLTAGSPSHSASGSDENGAKNKNCTNHLEDVGNEKECALNILMKKLKREDVSKIRFLTSNQVVPQKDNLVTVETIGNLNDRQNINFCDDTTNSTMPKEKEGIGDVWCAPRSTSGNKYTLGNLKRLVMKHDDTVLLTGFTFIWTLITLIFICEIAAGNV